jgi:hypothetical protein
MAKVYDIMEDSTGDEIHRDGDLFIGECTMQNQKKLLLLEKGASKQFPTSGVAIASFLLDERDGNDLKSDIQQEFEEDGMRIDKMEIKSLSNPIIQAEYNEES